MPANLLIVTARLSGKGYVVEVTTGQLLRLRRTPMWVPNRPGGPVPASKLVKGHLEPLLRWHEEEILSATLEFDEAPCPDQILSRVAGTLRVRAAERGRAEYRTPTVAAAGEDTLPTL